MDNVYSEENQASCVMKVGLEPKTTDSLRRLLYQLSYEQIRTGQCRGFESCHGRVTNSQFLSDLFPKSCFPESHIMFICIPFGIKTHHSPLYKTS